jgi:hypothetical protein
MAVVVEPLSTASRAAASSAQGSSWSCCQRSSCQRTLTRNQGGQDFQQVIGAAEVDGGEAAEERCQGFPAHRGGRHRQRGEPGLPGCWERGISADPCRVAVGAGVRLDAVTL